MSKFRVGDLVVGTQNSPYRVTNKYSICKVTYVSDLSYCFGDIEVKLLHNEKMKSRVGEIFNVDSKYFTLYREPDNFRRTKYE